MEAWASGAGFKIAGKIYVEMLPMPLKEIEKNKIRRKIDDAVHRFNMELKKKEGIKPDFGSIMIFHAFRTLCKIVPQILKADYEYFCKKNAYNKETKWKNYNYHHLINKVRDDQGFYNQWLNQLCCH